MEMNVPLAWKNLTHDPRKLMLAILGIGFAVVLMFQQRGFQLALFDSTVEILQDLDADIILFNPARFALTNEIRFPRRVLDLAGSVEGVVSSQPIYIENLRARLRRDGTRARPIRVVAWDLDQTVWLDRHRKIYPQVGRLHKANAALMDRLSHANYGFDLGVDSQFPQSGELNGKTIHILGTFVSGRDFAHEGNLLMSVENFLNYFQHRSPNPLETVDLGIIKVQAGASVDQTLESLRRVAGNEVSVMTRQQFISREIDFWARNTPIGIIFMIGTVIGFVVGVIICYQILANDITDHLGEFATLKAMGYGNSYFFSLVIRQAIYLATLGFVPGLIAAYLLFQFNIHFTGLLMRLSPERILVVFVATLLMCVLSGLLALRKLLKADPASLF